MRKFKINKLHFSISLLVGIALIAIPVSSILVRSHSAIKANKESVVTVEAIVQNSEVSPSPTEIPEKTPETQSSVITPPVNNQPTTNLPANNNVNNSDTISTFVKNGTIVYSGATLKTQIALTFDDGPDNNYTVKILDILKQNNIKATFFVVGRNAKTYPNVIKRIENEGHIIGSHTYNHADLNRLTPDQVRAEMLDTEAILDSIVGHHLPIIRPPYGHNSVEATKTISDMGYKIIDWSVDTQDWAGTPPSKIMEYVLKDTRSGSIILHHCSPGKLGLENTINVLPTEISTLKSKGYQFVTVPELLNKN